MNCSIIHLSLWSSFWGQAQIVEKERVAEDGEYNLSGERYRENFTENSKFEWVELGDVILGKPQYGSGARKIPYDNRVRYVRITDISDDGELKTENVVSPSVIEPNLFLEPKDLLIARSGSVGRTYFHGDKPGIHQYAGYLIRFRVDSARAIPKYVYYVTRSEPWRDWILSNSKTGTLTNINAKQYSSYRFPLPPLEVQQEIVAEIEGYQKVIDGARAVVENYRPHIHIDPDWPMVEFADAPFEIIDGDRGVNYPKKEDFASDGYCVFLNTRNVRIDGFNFEDVEFIAREKDEALRKGRLRPK